MAKEDKNKPFNIRFNPSYMDKIETIIRLTGRPKTEVMNEILASYFEDKILTNDFIELKNLLYFDMEELKEKGIVTAIKKPSIHNAPNYYRVLKVPNNLDEFDNETKTYYSDVPSVHKGIYIHFQVNYKDVERVIFTDVKDNITVITDIIEKYFIFEYDSSENALNISLVPFEDLYLYVPTGSSLLKELEKYKDNFYNNIVLDEETNELNYIEWLNKTGKVIQSYKGVKDSLIYRQSEGYKQLIREYKKLEKEEDLDLTYSNDNNSFKTNRSGAEFKEFYKTYYKPVIKESYVTTAKLEIIEEAEKLNLNNKEQLKIFEEINEIDSSGFSVEERLKALEELRIKYLDN